MLKLCSDLFKAKIAESSRLKEEAGKLLQEAVEYLHGLIINSPDFKKQAIKYAKICEGYDFDLYRLQRSQ